jgi:hypothetical protein
MKKTARKKDVAAKAVPRKAPAVKGRIIKAKATVKNPAVKSRPIKEPAAAKMPVVVPDYTADMMAELQAMRGLMERWANPAAQGDTDMDKGMDVIRRLLGDLVDARMEEVLKRLAGIVSLAAAKGHEEVVEALESVLADAGVIRFSPACLDFPDLFICRIAGDRADDAAAEGAIVDVVEPGYRTARGTVLAKAAVIINRRK